MVAASREGYTVSSDRDRLQLDVIHRFLTEAYWSTGIDPAAVARSIEHSLPFGLFHDRSGAQVGFARVITDRTTFGYLADVFVLPEHRGRGLARWMVRVILDDPELAGFRRWMLATRDAHAIYAAVGFTPLPAPERYMQLIPEAGPR